MEAIGGMVGVDYNPVSDFVTDYIEIDEQLLSTDRDVGTVYLSGPQLDDQFITVLRRFPNVVDIYLEESVITDRGLAKLARATQITHLQLYDSPGVTDAGIAELAKLPNLRYLELKNLPITGAGLSRFTQLEALYIDRCESLDSSSIPELSRLPRLTYLSFSESPITDEGLRGIAGAPVLGELSLDSTDITDASLSFIVEQFPKLTFLSLEGPGGITDEGVLQLAAFKQLKWLFMRDSNISAETVQALQQALPNCDVCHESIEEQTFGCFVP